MVSLQNMRWTSLIKWDEFYKKNESISYDSDNEEEVKNFDIRQSHRLHAPPQCSGCLVTNRMHFGVPMFL